MKFSLFKNDKSTAKDELILAVMILLCLGLGLVLFLTAPSFWIIDSSFSKIFGVMWIVIAVMFIPCLIYRLMTNNKD